MSEPLDRWEKSNFGKIAEVIMGQSPKGDDCNTLGLGMPLLNGPTEFGVKNPTPVQFTTSARKISEINDILFCVRGSTTGRMNWADQKYALGRGLAAIRHKKGGEYQVYIKGVIDCHLRSLLANATGSTFPNVSRTQLEEIEISIPSLSEQKSIADILSSFDDKIELLREQNKILETLAQTIFKEWFVKFNFPGATGEMIDSELGEIPKGWRTGNLGDVVCIFDSKRIPLSSNERQKRQGIYPYYGATKAMDYIDDYLFDGTYLLMAEDGSVMDDKGYPFLQYIWGKFWVNNHTHILQGKNGFSTEALYIFLKKRKVASIVNGAVQLKINQTNLMSFDMLLADNSVMQKFNEFSKEVFKKVKANTTQIQSLEKTRDALLPKLMSGKLRVD